MKVKAMDLSKELSNDNLPGSATTTSLEEPLRTFSLSIRTLNTEFAQEQQPKSEIKHQLNTKPAKDNRQSKRSEYQSNTLNPKQYHRILKRRATRKLQQIEQGWNACGRSPRSEFSRLVKQFENKPRRTKEKVDGRKGRDLVRDADDGRIGLKERQEEAKEEEEEVASRECLEAESEV